MEISRRTLLSGASALAASATFSWPRKVLAADGQVIVGTWGGDGAETLRKVVDTPLSAEGLEVIQDIGSGESRLTKLLVERTSAKGTHDVSMLNDADTYIASSQNVLAEINADSVPRSAVVLDKLQSPNSIPFVYTYQAIVYNTNIVDEPPTSYADLWDPKWEGKIGVADQMYNEVIASAALAAGGSMSDYEPAKEMLKKWKTMGTRVYPSLEAVAQALNSGEIAITIGLASRAVFWKRANIPLKFVLPSEGSSILVFRAMTPINAPNPEAAFKYLNTMLGAEAQAGLSRTMACMPVVSDVPVPEELADLLTVSPEDYERMLTPDFDYIQKSKEEYLAFWQREFRG